MVVCDEVRSIQLSVWQALANLFFFFRAERTVWIRTRIRRRGGRARSGSDKVESRRQSGHRGWCPLPDLFVSFLSFIVSPWAQRPLLSWIFVRAGESCVSGRYNSCPDVVFFSTPPFHGTLTRYHLHPENWLHAIPDNITWEEGALLEPLAVALAGIERANLRLGDPVVIWYVVDLISSTRVQLQSLT